MTQPSMNEPPRVDLNPTICRRLLIAYLIARLPRPNNPALEEITGWPRRTIQDVIAKGLPGHGTQVEFVQQGVRNNDGYYALQDWGSIDKGWVCQHLADIARVLELAPEQIPSPEK
ncbi:helix-turn-helix domain-containing protein [Microbulbifer sp. MCCC 1A16149]|uniref:helix-turn-helix domain-containing protein n=1 Tax=Microbulbifer sp. MCCC 1A16149 TaxID=3411322 RepID=UPI003D144FCF